jgi:hypothetical protein
MGGGGSRMSKKHSKINPDKNKKSKSSPPPTGNIPSPDIFSSKKHSMDYVTVNGVVLRTGYANKSYWYLLLIKELLDNAIDFLWKNYSGSADASVTVDITTDDSLFHIKVRNTNSRNIPVFENLSAIFDYDMRYGSKQNQHTISRGMLGDAMKQILSWPYVLIHTKDDGSSFKDRQWDKPLIIRCNGIERQIFLHVDKSNELIDVQINQIPSRLQHTDTEIETTWPIIDKVSLNIHDIERFCRRYIMLTTDIAFKFQLTDNNSTDDVLAIDRGGSIDVTSEIEDAITSAEASKAVDASALHSISTKWNNNSSIHSYKPEEFVSTITSVYDKDKTIVYDVLRMFKEGTQLAKTPDTEISVAQLLHDPNKDKKLESYYYQLKNILRPPERLSLPYSHLKTEERKKALIDRIMPLYPKGYFNTDRVVYKLVHDRYKDDKGILQYPFAFEIIAIPLSDEVLKQNINRSSEFIGAVNYSVAPRSNKFEGHYEWKDKKSYYAKVARDIHGILTGCGFSFEEASGPRVKLPSIIAANLISPRIDYKGKSKSDIDTQPFSDVIIEVVTKVASEIRTFRLAGYEFYSERELRQFSKPEKQAKRVEDVLEEVLRARKGEAGL